MNPTIIDTDTNRTLWRVIDCATYCNIKPSTWTTYTAQGRTPSPIAQLDARTPLWDALEVQQWHAARPGSPVPGAPTAHQPPH